MTKSTMLKISKDLELPTDAVTQKFAFLGRTGSGKSYASTKMCELMLGAGAQVIALDPVGVWWGLRTGAGFSIPVFGGLHGDIPLDTESGALLADLIVERNVSAVLDVSQLLSSQQRRFATAFIEQLFQRKKAAPSPVHLFLEECQEFVPQNVGNGETEMVHAFERMIKLGRNFGIGASLISQRPQEVNKKALNQTECLFAFQMTGPQERKAIESWVSEKGANDNIVDVLPKLKVGEPHVWSPQWLKVSKTIKIARKTTADVSSTPKLGQTQAAPQKLTAVDLDELRGRMNATIEKAKAEDPRELRREITRLKSEVEKAEKTNPVEMDPRDRELLRQNLQWIDGGFATRLEDARKTYDKTLQSAFDSVEQVAGVLKKYADMQIDLHKSKTSPPRGATSGRAEPPASPTSDTAAPGGAEDVGKGISKPQQRILDTMLTLERLGIAAPAKSCVAVFSEASPSSSSFGNNISALRAKFGAIEYLSGGAMHLTAAGRDLARDLGANWTLQEYHAAWFSKMTGPQARIISALIRAYPRPLSKQDLAREVEASSTSSSFGNNLSALRAQFHLVEYPGQGTVVATALLFPPQLS